MNQQIFELLSQYAVVRLCVSYDRLSKTHDVKVEKDGSVSGIKYRVQLAKLQLGKVTEVRFLANESPIIFYEFY